MPWKASKITLTEKQKQILTDISNSRTSRQDHIQRAKVITLSAQGLSNTKISEHVSLNTVSVGKWRNRWFEKQESLQAIENSVKTKSEYSRYIEGVLSDLPRAGTPPKFSSEQICQIYAVATEKPEESGLPLSHWSLSSLADELVKRNVVESISTSQLSVFLKSAGVKTSQS